MPQKRSSANFGPRAKGADSTYIARQPSLEDRDAAKTIYLFPDTNVFVQCKALEALDWTWLGEVDEIVLIVSRPVQNEIDDQKQRRRGRLSDRARIAYGVLRQLIINKAEKVMRPQRPMVRLTMGLTIKPTPDLPELDYDEPDDLLVACAHAYAAAHAGSDVRVLSHDGGPLGSAVAVNMPIAPVPDEWLLEPEQSESDKKLAVANAEITRLRKTEPEITIRCLDQTDASIDKLDIVHKSYDALSDVQVAALIQTLKDMHPIETDFGSAEPQTRPIASPMADALKLEETYEPAKPEDIEAYKTKTYPAWLATCEERLRELHRSLAHMAPIPTVTVEADNVGTRPADTALVEVVVEGRLVVMPPPRVKDHDEDVDDDSDGGPTTATPVILPQPPSPPYGRWNRAGGFGGYDTLEKLRRQADPFGLRRHYKLGGQAPDGPKRLAIQKGGAASIA